MDEFTPYILFILGLGVTGLGYWAKSLRDDLNKARADIVSIQLEYVKYERLKDIMQPVMDALQEIKDTLKTKADK